MNLKGAIIEKRNKISLDLDKIANKKDLLCSYISKNLLMETETKQKHFSDIEEFLFFIIPIVGIIVYAVTLNSNPEKSRRALSISLVGILFGIAAAIVIYI